jgi:hypothetical protein
MRVLVGRVPQNKTHNPVNRDIKMALPCQRYRNVYIWQISSIRLSVRPWGVAACPVILVNRSGKSHFGDDFIIRARYIYLSYYKKCRACNSL